jgi:hypothetical protein
LRSFLGALLLLLAPRASAQIGKPDRVRYLAVAGQAFDYRENQFAELQAFALGHDRPLFGSVRFVASTELTAAFLRQGTGRAGEKEWNVAVSPALVVAYRGGRRGGGLGYRLELGSGVTYAYHRLPAGGTKFNFYDQGGVALTLRRGRRGYALGYRMVHFSNLLLNPNPGITLHTVSFALEWYK